MEYADNVAFIWHDDKVILYRKEMTLTPNGAHNLLSQIYYGEDWLGSVEDDFRGSKGKLVECFKSFSS